MKLKLFFISIPLILLALFMFVKHNKGLIISTYNEYRPMLLNGGGEECLKNLKQIQASYKPLGNSGTPSCPILNAVRVTKYANTTLSSPFIISCPTALSVGNWLEDIKAKSISHVGTINCRSRRGSGLQSEHSFGIAIDITKIDDAVIKRDWKQTNTKGKKLRQAAKSACNYFSNVLTPYSNKLHQDHFHLDNGIGFSCHDKKKQAVINFKWLNSIF